MLRFTLRALALAAFYALLVSAQRNVTVINTDPSITYAGENISDAPICQIDPEGNVVSNSPGCYNFGPEPCTDSVTMGRGSDSSASFTFKGSAVYINSGLTKLSPLYTVTLDGQTEDVDGFGESGPATCQILFSRTGLDPSVDHTITLSVKGHSPQANSTGGSSSEIHYFFSLIDFTYTAEGSDGSGLPSSAVNSSLTTRLAASASPSGPGASILPGNTADDPEGAGVALSAPAYVALVFALAQVL
ncbi:hypothetical protein BKA70DRAFT_409127 [Coprinopsis sp. MPI-PUGE-AT-0042]|nr:hypothetical protein BKA70DRAFT_409127 [Coprinopsis sp. MPI-PUGE-AT-0042]